MLARFANLDGSARWSFLTTRHRVIANEFRHRHPPPRVFDALQPVVLGLGADQPHRRSHGGPEISVKIYEDEAFWAEIGARVASLDGGWTLISAPERTPDARWRVLDGCL